MSSKPQYRVGIATKDMDQGRKPDTDPKAPPATFLLPLNIAFYLCLTSHVLAALYAPIQDCDETFNYWEPLHYVNHGYGLQTWEYSPEYSIRSWTYVLIHVIPAKFATVFGKSKSFEFYFVRVVLAVSCAASETRLYSAISKHLHPRIGVFYLMVAAFTPGVFYASASFLPSSFAMYTSSLGLAALLNRNDPQNVARSIMWFAIGALIGWPFAGALAAPFVFVDWLGAVIDENVAVTFHKYRDAAQRVLLILGLQVAVDSLFYRKLTFVAWRIVSYNVFSAGDKGPDIFGTESWHFYLRNLALNFNLWVLLALAALPMLLLEARFYGRQLTKQSRVRTIVWTLPFNLWLTIFTLQPHKEERFMFPAYPFLALNAAIALHVVLVWVGKSDSQISSGKISTGIKLSAVLLPILVAINVGLFRILGTVTAYRAPLQTFEALSARSEISKFDTVCVGKEWYRFPASFFLPNGSHAKFIKSEFDGLLPGEFYESNDILGFLTGASVVPRGMNDQNHEDLGKYTDIDQCSYLIDSWFPNSRPTSLEPNYIQSPNWQKISCYPFLDTARTPLLARTIWIPSTRQFPRQLQRSWGEFCLLGRQAK